MKKFLIEHDRPNCIGCGACSVAASKFWEMNQDGKADVRSGKTRSDSWQELEISEKDFEDNKKAAESCPVNVIHLKNKENNEKII